jgi:hypothetical protein
VSHDRADGFERLLDPRLRRLWRNDRLRRFGRSFSSWLLRLHVERHLELFVERRLALSERTWLLTDAGERR